MNSEEIRAMIVCPLVLFCAVLATPPSAASEEAGAAETAEPTAEPEAAERADLTAVNDLVRTGAFADAERELARLQDEFPKDARVLLMRGEVLVALNRADEALPLLQKTVELDPARPRANFHMGTVLAAGGRADEALAAFGREIEVNEDTAVVVMARLNRSMLFQQQKGWRSAAAELEAVVGLEPGRVEAWGDLAASHQRAGDLDAARDALSRGAERGFRSADHYSSLGVSYHAAEKYDRAIEMFGAALEIDPDEPLTIKNLAASLQQAGRLAEAAARLKDYLRLRPNAPDRVEIAGRIEDMER